MDYVLFEDTGQVACRREPGKPYFMRKDGKWHAASAYVITQLMKGEAERLTEKQGRNALFESGQGGDPETELPDGPVPEG